MYLTTNTLGEHGRGWEISIWICSLSFNHVNCISSHISALARLIISLIKHVLKRCDNKFYLISNENKIRVLLSVCTGLWVRNISSNQILGKYIPYFNVWPDQERFDVTNISRSLCGVVLVIIVSLIK